MASVGQPSAHSRQPSLHFAASSWGRPRNPSGSASSGGGKGSVRYPCRTRCMNALSTVASPSQVVSAVREVEALVAEGEIRDRLVAHGHREPHPVVERRVHDLVAPEPPSLIRNRD